MVYFGSLGQKAAKSDQKCRRLRSGVGNCAGSVADYLVLKPALIKTNCHGDSAMYGITQVWITAIIICVLHCLYCLAMVRWFGPPPKTARLFEHKCKTLAHIKRLFYTTQILNNNSKVSSTRVTFCLQDQIKPRCFFQKLRFAAKLRFGLFEMAGRLSHIDHLHCHKLSIWGVMSLGHRTRFLIVQSSAQQCPMP